MLKKNYSLFLGYLKSLARVFVFMSLVLFLLGDWMLFVGLTKGVDIFLVSSGFFDFLFLGSAASFARGVEVYFLYAGVLAILGQVFTGVFSNKFNDKLKAKLKYLFYFLILLYSVLAVLLFYKYGLFKVKEIIFFFVLSLISLLIGFFLNKILKEKFL